MKPKIIKPDKDFELETQVQKSEHPLADPNEDIVKANICWLDYGRYGPFCQWSLLALLFDELKKTLKQWLAKKDTTVYK